MKKRLTEVDEYGNYDIIECPSEIFAGYLMFDQINAVTEALNRLGEYENTNLSPKEIEKIKCEYFKNHEKEQKALNTYEQRVLDWANLQEWNLIEKIFNDGTTREYTLNVNGVKFTITNFYRFEEEFIKLIAKYRI